MANLDQYFDKYALQARMYPAFLCALPVASIAIALVGDLGSIGVWLPLLGSIGVLFFLTNLVRSRGKKLEPTLVETWGGLPTTIKLRGSSQENVALRDRRRTRLETLLGEALPTSADEFDEPQKSDERYVTAVRVLISHVRDDSARYPRVHEENINYGFRRNLLALKPPALAVIAVSLLLDLAIFVSTDQDVQAVLLTLLHICAASAWIGVVKEAWVREAADSYAERLFDTLEKPEPGQ